MKTLAWVAALLIAGCGDDGSSSGPAGPQTVTLEADEGVVFDSGEVFPPGPPFSKTDLYTIGGGSNGSFQIDTGKAKLPDPGSPVTWFDPGGGIPRKFGSLEEVPKTTPTDDMTDKLLSVKQGYGFVVKNYISAAGYTRGWIKEVRPDSIVIEYERLEEASP